MLGPLLRPDPHWQASQSTDRLFGATAVGCKGCSVPPALLHLVGSAALTAAMVAAPIPSEPSHARRVRCEDLPLFPADRLMRPPLLRGAGPRPGGAAIGCFTSRRSPVRVVAGAPGTQR